MVYCVIAGCKNRSDTIGKKLRFFTFPKDEYVCKKWVNACGRRKSFKIDCARICSEHFVQSDFKLQDILLNVPPHKRRLQNGAIPSQSLPNEKRVSKKEKKRIRQENKAIVEECLASYERTQMKTVFSGNSKNEELDDLIQAEGCYQREAEETLSTGIKSIHKNNEIFDPIIHTSPSSWLKDKRLGEHSYSHIKYFTNGSTQTEFDYDCCKELHIMRLEAQNRKLMCLIKKHATRAQENESLRSSLKNILTTGQINRLIHPGKKLKWRAEDIASAMSLYSSGPVAYAHLRKRNFPLPSSSTLRGWAGKIEIKPGILKSVLNLMNKLNYDGEDRLCVIYFNKIRLKCSSYSDKSENVALTKAKYAYVVMARGLIKDWAQIVYYEFDVPITWSVLKPVITNLEKIKFTVTAVISDLSPAVSSLWEELSISEHHPYILHPSDECKKIFFFVDALYLLKMIRNRFISTGFLLHDKQIDSKPIKEILNYDKMGLKITYEHLDLNKFERRKENLAVQLFSPSVSAALKKFTYLGKIECDSGEECANFIDLISNWFKIFNPKCSSIDLVKDEEAFDLDLNILTKMNEMICNLRSPKKHIALRFQNGVLLNNIALTQMWSYITINYTITSILTDRLNYQELEQFFNIVRSKGNPQDHPTPLEFKYRLRSSLLSKMIL